MNDGWMDGQMYDVRQDGWMDHGQMDGLMLDEWMDDCGRMDGLMYRR